MINVFVDQENGAKIFRDQGNMSEKHFWEQGVLIMGNKILDKIQKEEEIMGTCTPPPLKGAIHSPVANR